MSVIFAIKSQEVNDENIFSIADEETMVKSYLDAHERHRLLLSNQWATGTWNFETNMTEDTLLDLFKCNAKYAEGIQVSRIQYTQYSNERTSVHLLQSMANVLKGFQYNEFKDEDLKRRIRLMLRLSYHALPKDKFLEYNRIVSAMKYSTHEAYYILRSSFYSKREF